MATSSYDDICRSFWLDGESDDEHAERIERCTNEANTAYARAISGPLATVRQTMTDIRPYSGSPKWQRMKDEANRKFKEETAPAYALFLREFEDLMRDGETSEATSFAWDAFFAGQMQECAA